MNIQTFFVMQLWIQGKTDFGGADMLELMLIVLNATKLPDNFSQDIILVRAYGWHVAGNEVMYREDVRHLDV